MSGFYQNKLVRLIFFGNFFYGFCAVALACEAMLQQGFPAPGILFSLLVFSATVVFYSKAYIVTEISEDLLNERSAWYHRNHRLMKTVQLIFLMLLGLGSLYFAVERFDNLWKMTALEWFCILVFPFVSLMYYGFTYHQKNYNLRNIGWLKAFLIAYSWAGLVTIYPVIFYNIDTGTHYVPTFPAAFLFIKNFMFIAVLCILFDIKDYAMDYNQQLKTLVVNLGLRRTIFYLIIPLCVVGLSSFLIYASYRGFSGMKIFLNTIPFLAVIIVAWSMSNRRGIFYYLVVIDGLMLLKAVCGIVAMSYF